LPPVALERIAAHAHDHAQPAATSGFLPRKRGGHPCERYGDVVSQSDYYRGVEVTQTALRESAEAPPARRAEAVHEAMAPWFLQTSLSAARACHRGCSHCCHLPVGVTFGEAMRLAAAVRNVPELAAHVAQDAMATAALPWSQLVGKPCPLLVAHACVVHPFRPLPCRALASSDAAACERGARGAGDVPVDDEAFWRGLGAASALATADAPTGTRELRSALGALLQADPMLAGQAFAEARVAGPDDA
jgi:hypothetical protein